LRASLRFSSRAWMNDPRHTTVKKNRTTPSEKNDDPVVGLADQTLAVVAPAGPGALGEAIVALADLLEREPVTGTRPRSVKPEPCGA